MTLDRSSWTGLVKLTAINQDSDRIDHTLIIDVCSTSTHKTYRYGIVEFNVPLGTV